MDGSRENVSLLRLVPTCFDGGVYEMVLASWLSALVDGVVDAALLAIVAALLFWLRKRRLADGKGPCRVLRALAIACAVVALFFAARGMIGSIQSAIDQRPVSSDVVSYLADTATDLDLSAGNADTSAGGLNPASFGKIDGYRVFLAGEDHTLAKSYEARRLMIRFLYEHANVRYLLVEGGVGDGLLLDCYVQTGDEALLDSEIAALKGTMSYTRETRDFWTWLHGFNAGSPEGERLHVIGLDVDHQASNAARGIATLVNGDTELPGPWAGMFDRLRNGDEEAVGDLSHLLDEDETAAKAVFGDKLDMARRACQSVDAAERYYKALNNGDTASGDEIRDGWMMASFEFALEHAPANARFFGQFGGEHVYQAACDTQFGTVSFNRFAMRLCADGSPVAGEVCSMLYAYTNAGALPLLRTYGDSGRYFEYGPLEPWYGRDVFFELDGQDSPFADTSVFIKCGADPDAPDTAYIQKLLLLSDSPETTPMG